MTDEAAAIPRGADHFEVLGLPKRFLVDPAELTRRFISLSRRCHPDRFAGGSPEEIAQAQRASARVNDAYRALKDPVSRAEHLLEIEGVSRPEGEAKCPPEILMEVFELRERLAEEPSEEVREEVLRMIAGADAKLHELYAAHDGAGADEDRAPVLREIRAALDRRKFLTSLHREVEQALG